MVQMESYSLARHGFGIEWMVCGMVWVISVWWVCGLYGKVYSGPYGMVWYSTVCVPYGKVYGMVWPIWCIYLLCSLEPCEGLKHLAASLDQLAANWRLWNQ